MKNVYRLVAMGMVVLTLMCAYVKVNVDKKEEEFIRVSSIIETKRAVIDETREKEALKNEIINELENSPMESSELLVDNEEDTGNSAIVTEDTIKNTPPPETLPNDPYTDPNFYHNQPLPIAVEDILPGYTDGNGVVWVNLMNYYLVRCDLREYLEIETYEPADKEALIMWLDPIFSGLWGEQSPEIQPDTFKSDSRYIIVDYIHDGNLTLNLIFDKKNLIMYYDSGYDRDYGKDYYFREEQQ